MKNFKLITLLLILGLFAGLVGCVSEEEEEKQEKEQVNYLKSLLEGWKVYENKEWGFRIKYPADWWIWSERTKIISGEEVFYFACSPKTEETTSSIISPVPPQEPPPERPFEDITFGVEIGDAHGKSPEERYDEALSKAKPLMAEINAIDKEERSNCSLGGLPALEVVWIYKVPDPEEKGEYRLTSKGKVVITVKDDKYYSPGFTTIPMENYEKWINTVDKMISSFEFI
jgi:hypothetical protein